MKELFAKKFLYSALLFLVVGNIFMWQKILFDPADDESALYFLNVGQGDASLIDLGRVEILVDGGKGPQVLNELAKVLSPTDRYIDIVIATHPDFDHFGGLIDVLRTYKVSAVITNGRVGTAAAYDDFIKAVNESGAQGLNLLAGDRIQYQNAIFKILSPDPKDITGKSNNDSGIVFLLEMSSVKSLYTADIGFDKEAELLRRFDLKADILKVAHHGSKYSSSPAFLREVRPKISVIGVGKNTYGHPTTEAINRLASIQSLITRTDQDGTIKIKFNSGQLAVYSLK